MSPLCQTPCSLLDVDTSRILRHGLPRVVQWQDQCLSPRRSQVQILVGPIPHVIEGATLFGSVDFLGELVSSYITRVSSWRSALDSIFYIFALPIDDLYFVPEIFASPFSIFCVASNENHWHMTSRHYEWVCDGLGLFTLQWCRVNCPHTWQVHKSSI
jgi:hypothetical protein